MSVRGCGHCCSGLHTSRPAVGLNDVAARPVQHIAGARMSRNAGAARFQAAGSQAGLRGKFKPHSAAASIDERVF